MKQTTDFNNRMNKYKNYVFASSDVCGFDVECLVEDEGLMDPIFLRWQAVVVLRGLHVMQGSTGEPSGITYAGMYTTSVLFCIALDFLFINHLRCFMAAFWSESCEYSAATTVENATTAATNRNNGFIIIWLLLIEILRPFYLRIY